MGGGLTLVFEEVAHAGAPSEHDLGDVLDDLGLGLWSHRREPFRETDLSWSERM